MSESQEPAPAGPSVGETAPVPGSARPAAGARYPRSSGGLLGAMLVTVLAVVAFAAFRGVTRDNDPTPVRTVDYQAVAKMARADGRLTVAVPEALPQGWKATSATYARGAAPAWHLGMLTEDRKYVGIEESRASIADLAREHVDPDAERGEDVTINGTAWQSWTDAGGDYAVGLALQATGRGNLGGTWLVVGTAPEKEIRDLAGTLKGVNSLPTG